MAKRKTRNLFRNTQGKWCIDITVKKHRVIRVIGDSKREAEVALTVIKSDLLHGKIGFAMSSKNVLFKDFAEKFLDTYASKKRSFSRDLISFRCHLKPHFGDLLLQEIKIERVENYQAARMAETTSRKTEEGEPRETSGATINRELALLRTMLNKAIEWEYLDVSPVNWKRVKKLRENSRERYLTPEEKGRLFEALDGASPALRAFIVLAVNTGMRKGEILGLRWSNVNLEDGLICLERSQRKNNKVLRIPLNQPALEVLAGLPRASEYVLCAPKTGARFGTLRRSFTTACRKAGIKDLRIHDLRHTFGTMLNARGVDLPTICSLLGHSSITMTSKYITPITEVQKRAVDSLVEGREPERKKNESLSNEASDERRERVYIQ